MSKIVLNLVDGLMFRLCFGFWKSELRALYAELCQRDDTEWREIGWKDKPITMKIQNTAFSLYPYLEMFSIQADYETAQRLKIFRKVGDGWAEEFSIQQWKRADKQRPWYGAIRKLLK